MRRSATEGSLAERARVWQGARRAGAQIRAPFRLPHARDDRPSARIRFGAGAFVGPRAWLNVQPGGRLTIGAGASIAESLAVSTSADVTIGDGCLLSARVFLLDAQHDYLAWIVPALQEGREPAHTWDMQPGRPVRIGAGSWLGVGVVVLPGVEIGPGCVVGANSVVTRSLEPFTVAAGAPARVVRRIERPAP